MWLSDRCLRRKCDSAVLKTCHCSITQVLCRRWQSWGNVAEVPHLIILIASRGLFPLPFVTILEVKYLILQ